MNIEFLANLCEMLAHTIVYEAKQHDVGLKCCGPDIPEAQKAGPATAEQMQATIKNMPAYYQAIAKGMPALEKANWDIAQQYSPQYSALQTQLYQQNAPALNQVSRDILTQNMMAQAEAENRIAQTLGRDLTKSTLATAKLADPEYYAMREALAGQLQNQMANPVTGGEYEALQRGINAQNVAQGNSFVPSAANTVAAAQKYGSAYNTRLGQVLDRTIQSLPAMKSGFDVFQQATGRSGMGQLAGAGQFLPVNQQLGQQNVNTLSSMAGDIAKTAQQNYQTYLQQQTQAGLIAAKYNAGTQAGMGFATMIPGMVGSKWSG